jgi:hypothetical protein
MESQATRTTSPPPDPSESEKQRKIAALAFETDWPQDDQQVGGETGTVRPRRTPVGLFLIAPPRS